MIKSKELVRLYRLQIGRFSYAEMDCIKSIENIITRHGGRSDLVGSNWWARYELRNLRPLTERSQLYDGCAVLKTVHPGESGYNLPLRYKNHVNLIDYNHIGLGTDEGEILDSTRYGQKPDGTWTRNGPGVSTAPINSRSWDIIAEFDSRDVDYSDRQAQPPAAETEDFTMTGYAHVTAKQGSTVNLRNKAGGSVILEQVPLGTKVQTAETQGAWTKIYTPSGKTGWMKKEFLAVELPGGELVQISLPREAALALRQALDAVQVS